MRRTPTAMIGLVLFCALLAMAIFAPFIAPYDPLQMQVRERLHTVPILVVPMFVDSRTNESRHNLDVIHQRFGQQVVTQVPVRTRMREAIADGVTIFEYAPREDIAEIYQELARHLVATLNAMGSESGQ